MDFLMRKSKVFEQSAVYHQKSKYEGEWLDLNKSKNLGRSSMKKYDAIEEKRREIAKLESQIDKK